MTQTRVKTTAGWLDLQKVGPAGNAPQRVTSLPTGSAEGTEIYLDMTNYVLAGTPTPPPAPALLWHFRKTSGAWIAVGQQEPIKSAYETDLVQSSATGTWLAIARPTLAIPFAGTWELEGFIGYLGPEGANISQTLTVGSSSSGGDYSVAGTAYSPTAAFAVGGYAVNRLVFTAGQLAQFWQNRSSMARFGNRLICARPASLVAT